MIQKINDIKNKILDSDNVVVEFVMDLVFNVIEFDIGDKAASMTYYLALCVGPFMMGLLMILETYIKNNMDTMIGILSEYMQDPEIVIEPLLDYVSHSKGGTIAIFAIGVALFSASKAINNLIRYMDEILGFNEDGGLIITIKNRALSIVFTLAFIFSIILFLATYVYGDPISLGAEYFLGIDVEDYAIWGFVSRVLPVMYLMLVLMGMYKLLPSREGDNILGLQEVLFAAGFSTIGWTIASKGFQFYIANFNKNNLMYGMLGNFMILLLWFYILMFIILLGTVVMDVFRRDYGYKLKD